MTRLAEVGNGRLPVGEQRRPEEELSQLGRLRVRLPPLLRELGELRQLPLEPLQLERDDQTYASRTRR